jgi:hypothetical protein
MAMQRADPAAGTATREMSRNTESEGHFLSAASFGASSRAFAQPKNPNHAGWHRGGGKPLQDMHLCWIEEPGRKNHDQGRERLKCRILHIRCIEADLGSLTSDVSLGGQRSEHRVRAEDNRKSREAGKSDA